MMVLDKQMELFPKATVRERAIAKYLLEKYVQMKSLIKDFEQHTAEYVDTTIDGKIKGRIDDDELHSDKTANAVVLTEKQRYILREYKYITSQLERAYGQIRDADAKKTIQFRYIEGYTHKETILFFQRSMSHATIDRKLQEGIDGMANGLKLMGAYERDWLQKMRVN